LKIGGGRWATASERHVVHPMEKSAHCVGGHGLEHLAKPPPGCRPKGDLLSARGLRGRAHLDGPPMSARSRPSAPTVFGGTAEPPPSHVFSPCHVLHCGGPSPLRSAGRHCRLRRRRIVAGRGRRIGSCRRGPKAAAGGPRAMDPRTGTAPTSDGETHPTRAVPSHTLQTERTQPVRSSAAPTRRPVTGTRGPAGAPPTGR